MDIGWPAAQDAYSQRVWAEVIRPVAVQLRDATPALAVELAEAMRVAMPELGVDADSVSENRASAEASLRLITELLERAADPAGVELPTATAAYARTEVQRRVALAAISNAYRVAHEFLWGWFLERIAEHARDKRQLQKAIELMSSWLFAFVRASVTAAEQIHLAEQDVWLRTLEAARAEAIAEIMEGLETDARRAEQRLRHPIAWHHVAVIAWTNTALEGDVQQVLDAALARAAAALDAEAGLPHTTGLGSAVRWISRPAAFSAGDLDRAGALSKVPADVRLALGEPAPGLAGLRRTYIEAGHARRIATMLGADAPGATRYRDIAVVALATADVDQAAVFVDRVLGRLAAGDEATSRVAETLAVYLDEQGSRTRAGERLGVHSNTVRYRVLQAEELLGRGLATDTLDLRVALALLPALRSRAAPQERPSHLAFGDNQHAGFVAPR